MYNYSEDKNLTKFYKYLKANSLYDQFIEHIVNEDEVYKNMLKILKKNNKNNKKQEKNT